MFNFTGGKSKESGVAEYDESIQQNQENVDARSVLARLRDKLRPNAVSRLERDRQVLDDMKANQSKRRLFQRQAKPQFVLTRFHPHLIKPFVNDNMSRKPLTHSGLTTIILFGTFMIGYSYARLRNDEYLRRMMYARYSNFMVTFDKFGDIYDKRYDNLKHGVITFDSDYSFWEYRNLKKNEWKYWLKTRREVKIEADDTMSLMI